MIFTINNIEELNNIRLHDCEVSNINIDYNSKRVTLFINSPNGKKILIKSQKFYFISIQGFEPWGEGFYIYSFQIIRDIKLEKPEYSIDNVFGFELLINSGDKIVIYVRELLIE